MDWLPTRRYESGTSRSLNTECQQFEPRENDNAAVSIADGEKELRKPKGYRETGNAQLLLVISNHWGD